MSPSTEQRTVHCQILNIDVPVDEAIPADLVRASILPHLVTAHGSWDPAGYVSREAVNTARMKHIESILQAAQDDDIANLNAKVMQSVTEHQLLAVNIEKEFEKNLTFGDQMADKIAAFGGSWKFIGLFAFILCAWMGINSFAILKHPFDAFPFIFLNLILSCLAAIQAPVIMMSQNRQEQRERLSARNDYMTNLKAEVEIRALHEKVDLLLNDQWKHLLEIQEMQVEMIREITQKHS